MPPWTTCSCTTPGAICATPYTTRRCSRCPSGNRTDAMHRTWAIIERELRRFRRSPMVIVMSMIFPVCQLVTLGYAFGGSVKHLKVAVVDQDHGVPAVRVREMAGAVSAGAHIIDTIEYADEGQAL